MLNDYLRMSSGITTAQPNQSSDSFVGNIDRISPVIDGWTSSKNADGEHAVDVYVNNVKDSQKIANLLREDVFPYAGVGFRFPFPADTQAGDVITVKFVGTNILLPNGTFYAPEAEASYHNHQKERTVLDFSDLIDAKVEASDARVLASEARIDTKFLELRTDMLKYATVYDVEKSTASVKNTVWATAIGAFTLALAILAFAGDRFAAGIDVSGIRFDQLKRDDEQDARGNRVERKIDQIIKATQENSANSKKTS